MKNIFKILFLLLICSFPASKSMACDGLTTTVVSNSYIGNGQYEITIEVCEEVSNSDGLVGFPPTSWATIYGILISVNGANIVGFNPPTITGITQGTTVNGTQTGPNQIEYGDWGNSNAPIILDYGDPLECWTFQIIVDGPAVSIDILSSSYDGALQPGNGMAQYGGIWGCGDVTTVPPPSCDSQWNPPTICSGSTTPIDLNTTTSATGIFSGTGVNSGTGILDPSGITSNVPVTFTVNDNGFTCSTTHDIVVIDLTPPNLTNQTICQGDQVNLDATINVVAGCTYTLVLDDSYGDGWNGADCDIYINGVPFQMNQTVPDCGGTTPCQTTISIPVNSGDVILLNYSGGTWDSENTIFLYDDQMNLVNSINNPPDGNLGSGIIANCSNASINYSWSPTTGLSNPNIANPTASPGTTTTYTVDISSNDFPCTTQASVTITVDPCLNCMITNFTQNSTACDPLTGFYQTSGIVEFTDAPTTGQLIVEDCNGVQQVFNAPFTSPVNYLLTMQTANGGGCDVTAYFTADLACNQTINYTAPICLCNIDAFNASIGTCDQNTNTYSINGDVTFTSPPGVGTLIVSVDNGTSVYDTIIFPPFTSPQTWSISGIPADGANSTVTVYFSADPGCISVINYTAPTDCSCNADVGTFSANMNGMGQNNYVLCYGDDITITSNGDWTGPGEMFNPPGPPYNPGITWLIFSCPPTTAAIPNPNLTVMDDPCFIGVVSNTTLFDINDMSALNSYPPGTFSNNTIYYVPITMYDQIGLTYSYVNGTMPCYELGPPFAVQYLPEFSSSFTEDCLTGEAVITVNGALPEIDGSNFNASNLLPTTASFSNNSAINGGNITINGLQGGDLWSFDVTDDNGCTYTINGGPFQPLEDPGFTYPQLSWCTTETPASPIITGVNGGTFTSTPAGLTINGSTGQITPATSIPGTYNVTYTTPGACFNDSTITVNIAATPAVDPIADQTVCSGVNFTTINITGSAGSIFNWTNNNISIGLAAIGNGDITSFTGTAGVTQEVATVTVTPSAGACVGTPTTFNLTVDPAEDPTFTYPASAWCTSDAVQAATITGTTGGTFAAVPAGLTLNAATGDITPGTSTPGTYDVTYTTPGPCTATSTVTVTINEVPVVDPVVDETVCVGTNFTTVNFTSTTPGTTFDWTNDNVFTGLGAAGTGNMAAFAGQTNGGTIASNVTVTPSTVNCTGTPITFTLTVNDLDDATFDYTPGLTYCQTAADPVVNITGLAGGTFSYAAVSGGPILSLNTGSGGVTLLTSDVGNYDITYNTTGAFGSLCPNTFTLQLVITSGPTADFTLDVYCTNDADPIPTYINGGSGGTFSAVPAGLSINANSGLVDLDASTPGTYTVTNDINVAGCPTATYTDDITIYALPDATISGSQTVCAGDPIADGVVTLTAGSNVPSWSLNYNYNNTAQGPVVVNNPATTYNINPTYLGTYTINSVTDGNGCTQIVTGSITIDNFPVPTMNILNDQEICDGDNLAIQSFGSDIPATYAWTNTTGTDIGFGLNGNGDIGSFAGVNPGTTSIPVTVEVTPTSLDGCPGTPAQFNVTVHPRPQVFFEPGTDGCEPLSDTLINLTNIAGQSCEWDFGDGTSAFGCDTVYHTYMAGTYDVSLTVTTQYGCTGSYSINSYITVNEMPEASFVYMPQEINVDNTIVEFTNTSINAASYLWDFGDGSSTSNQEDVPHMYPQVPDEYTVTLWAYNGVCEDMYQQIVKVKDVLIYYVPNVFTPDGDQFNEMFQPVFTSGFDPFDFHLTIFNRWGEIIFESFDASRGWDGHYGDGGLVQDGVYVWQIEFKESMADKKHTARGHVTVLK